MTEAQKVLTEADFNPIHYFSAGVYAKRFELPAGRVVPTHVHKYDHLSILAKGMVIVEAGGVSTTYKAPAALEVARGVVHTIMAIDDSVWFCIHPTEATTPEEVDAQTLVIGA